MNMQKFLEDLRENDIHLAVDGNGDLDVKAPKTGLDQSIIDEIRSHKTELVDYLSKASLMVEMGKGIPVAPPSDSYPLSSSQMRLWVLDRVFDGSAAYNIPAYFVLNGSYSVEIYGNSINEVIRRHEILRTVFRKDGNGEIRQWVLAPEAVNFQISDVDLRASGNAYDEAMILINEDNQRPYDLSNAPLFRVMLIRLGDARYIFYYNMHHIISDGWSMDILKREVLLYHQYYEKGIAPNLAPLSLQYKDYSVWQQEQLGTGAFGAHREYWMNQMGGGLPVLDLSIGKVRPARQTDHGHRLLARIDPATVTRLKEQCAAAGTTLFMGLVASLNALLYRYSGQEDIVIGSPVSGREYAAVHDQIGFYVNTLALRTAIRAEDTFQDLLGRVEKIILGVYAHQAYPFDRLIEDLGLRRDPSRSPVFDVMIVLQNHEKNQAGSQVETGDEIRDLGPYSIKFFDLVFDFQEVADTIHMVVQFNTDIYGKGHIQQLVRHYISLLESMTAAPATPIKDNEYLSLPERQRLLGDFNDTDVREEEERTIVEMFDRQAELTPGSVAVYFEGQELSYGELQGKANELAWRLSSAGVGVGDWVSLVMTRGTAYVVSFLAVLKAGAGVVPLGVDWPAERLELVLGELGCRAILVNAEGLKRSGLTRREEMVEVELGQLAVRASFSGPQPSMEAPLYMLYTSGSTGRPKGVVVPHKGIVNRFLWMNDYFGRESAMSVLRTTQEIFDSSVWQLFWPLINGGKTVIPSEGRVLDLDHFSELVDSQQIRMTDFVPSLFNELVEELRENGAKKELAGLRDIVIGGEAIQVSAVNLFRQWYPGIRLTNLYGPTEASIGCIYYEIKAEGRYERIPIGRPIRNVRIYILDRWGQLMPAGVSGEICISGTCLADGYFRDEERTAARFVSNRYGKQEHGRMYRTGDLGRWMQDGNIEYLGRMDEQIKIRGYRIEPGEIENLLKGYGDVRDAVVMKRKTNAGEDALIAYLTGKSRLDVEMLRSWLEKELPAQMVPRSYLQVQDFPLLANGKVDRKRLADLADASAVSLKSKYIRPTNEVESALVDIWKEVLEMNMDIGIRDDFFDLGGHSIKAIRILSRVAKEFGATISVQSMFEEPTVEGLAKRVLNTGWATAAAPMGMDANEYKEIEI